MAQFTEKKLGPRRIITYKDDFEGKWEITFYTQDDAEIYNRFSMIIGDDADYIADADYNSSSGKSIEQIKAEYNKRHNDFEAAWQNFLKAKQEAGKQASSDLKNLAFFQDDSILTEEAFGLKINQDGMWKSEEFENPEEFMKKFEEFEQSVTIFGRLIHKGKVEVSDMNITATTENISSFDSNGDIPKKLFKCPNCGKMVEQLLPNGYCSKLCATKARAERAKSKMSDNGEKTLQFIAKVQDKLKLLDMALNLITTLPELIKGKAKLPQEYRDYVTLRIDVIFLEIKKYINVLMIMKNDALIELMKKVKFGDLDSKLQVIIQPLTTILTVIAQVQQALNMAVAVVLALLKVPMLGIGPQSYGWLMTAKSAMFPEHAGKLIVEIIPKTNLALDFPNKLNIMNYAAIEKICQASLPPIQDFEYFLDPTAFKVRYALSQDNVPRLKKLQQMLEMLMVFGADTFPRYERLSLTNVWFVLSILTGWGPTSRGVFGDFIFHGPM